MPCSCVLFGLVWVFLDVFSVFFSMFFFGGRVVLLVFVRVFSMVCLASFGRFSLVFRICCYCTVCSFWFFRGVLGSCLVLLGLFLIYIYIYMCVCVFSRQFSMS